MNTTFSEYVRSGAFTLQLSERMIYVLLALADKGPADDRLNLHPYSALARRGLITYKGGDGPKITKAGKLVAEMLVIAGYKENPKAKQA